MTERSGSVRRRALVRSIAAAVGLGVGVAGCLDGFGGRGGDDAAVDDEADDDADRADVVGLETLWTSETHTSYDGNHHLPAIATVDGETAIVAPLNEGDGVEGCGLAAIDADGDDRWRATLPAGECNAHAVGDVAAAEFEDGRVTFLAGTSMETLVGYDADGDRSFEHDLSGAGYSRPTVADLGGDGEPSIVVVDLAGTAQVLDPDGSVRWERDLGDTVVEPPVVLDRPDGEGRDVAVLTTAGDVTRFDPDGNVVWESAGGQFTASWTAVEREGGSDLVIAGREGALRSIDAESGDERWTATIAERPIVEAPEGESGRVYATTNDGTGYAIDANDGEIVWNEPLVDGGPDVVSGPTVGDATGDGDLEVVVATSDGSIVVADAETGDRSLEHETDGSMFVRPVIADVTGDGANEIVVVRGDGRVAAFSIER